MLGYSFPCNFDAPYEHQKEMFLFHLKYPHCFNLSTMGTGKTMGSLWTCDFLLQHKKISKILIVAPLSILDSIWKKNIFEHLIHRKYVVLHGSKKVRLQLLAKDVEFFIINHDGIKVIEEELIAKKFDICIADEMTAFKNSNTDRFKAMYRIAKSAKGVIGMTGSPVSDNPTDAYGQAKLVKPDNPALPKYFGQFRDRIMSQMDEFTWIPKLDWEHEVNKILSPAVRFKLRDCVDLPPTLYEERVVKMSVEQEQAFKEMKQENYTLIKDGVVTAANAGVRYLKLLQISSGIGIDENQIVRELNCNPKLKEIDVLYNEFGCGPTIVSSSFRGSILLIAKYLRKKYPYKVIEVVDGGVSRKQRADIFSRFDQSLVDFLVIQPKVAAHGLNLTSSRLFIWFAPHPSNEVFEQANARIARLGQKYTQIIAKLSCSRSETAVYNALQRKDKLSNLYLSLLKDP
ncbi:MAG: hypothetical protein CMB80_16395 [Flammeovirgaceae bacterium]|nr:hypothetical protein [Flammeovirgaceae bacterium]